MSSSNINVGPQTEDVFLIWTRYTEDSSGTLSVEGAWDEAAIEENPQGWADARSEAVTRFGAENVRITKVTINFDAVKKAFDPVDVTIKPTVSGYTLRGDSSVAGRVTVPVAQQQDGTYSPVR